MSGPIIFQRVSDEPAIWTPFQIYQGPSKLQNLVSDLFLNQIVMVSNGPGTFKIVVTDLDGNPRDIFWYTFDGESFAVETLGLHLTMGESLQIMGQGASIMTVSFSLEF